MKWHNWISFSELKYENWFEYLKKIERLETLWKKRCNTRSCDKILWFTYFTNSVSEMKKKINQFKSVNCRRNFFSSLPGTTPAKAIPKQNANTTHDFIFCKFFKDKTSERSISSKLIYLFNLYQMKIHWIICWLYQWLLYWMLTLFLFSFNFISNN